VNDYWKFIAFILINFYYDLNRRKKMNRDIGKCGAPSGAIYGLGFIGAAVYFISNAAGFWIGVLGFLKAIVWPAILVYELFKHMAM